MEVIILIIVCFVCAIAASIFFYKKGKRDAVQPTLIKNDKLKQERQNLNIEITNLKNNIEEYKELLADKQKSYDDFDEIFKQTKQARYDQLDLHLQQYEAHIQEECEKKQIQLDNINTELNSLRQTRQATIAAYQREQEIEDNTEFFSLQIPESEVDDINYLNKIKHNLHFPIVIGKVIWSTFIQKKVDGLAARALPQKITTGIYKITNILSKECYIGQSVDVRKRWIDHCKAGIGAVEVSASNKLYAAFRETGLENFTFELLEECERSELNDKERYYINLYSSDTLGYNSNAGVKN